MFVLDKERTTFIAIFQQWANVSYVDLRGIVLYRKCNSQNLFLNYLHASAFSVVSDLITRFLFACQPMRYERHCQDVHLLSSEARETAQSVDDRRGSLPVAVTRD